MSGYSIVIGGCYSCGRRFGFNPYSVPSLLIDPQTGLPPDVDEHGHAQPIEAHALARSVREPICESCVEIANARHAARDEPLIVVLDGAYEPIEGMP
jgi:hypothetical protein